MKPDQASEGDAEEARDAEADEDGSEQESEDGDSGSEDATEADAQAEADAKSDNEAEEAEQEALINPRIPKSTRTGGRPKVKPKKVTKVINRLATAEELKHVKTAYDSVNGDLDRYGVVIGTKTHAAVLLYEKGTTSKELLEKVGGRFYNILRRLSIQGHLTERDAEGVFTLTHRDDIKALKEKRKAVRLAAEGKGKKK